MATDRSRENRHAHPRESFHLPADMQKALERLVDDTRPPTTKSAICRVALEEYLMRAGYWPEKAKRRKS